MSRSPMQHPEARRASSQTTFADEAAVIGKNESRLSDLLEKEDDDRSPSPAALVGEPPNGGLTAWLQVLASFLLFFNTWGLINSFGVFETYYVGALSRSPSDVAWVGTFQAFLVLFVGSVTGPLFDKGYLRLLLFTGTFAVVFGLMMTSLSTQYYQVFLAQSVVIGLGSGALQVPSLAISIQYFTTRRALAIGTAAAGGSIGALLYPIVFRRMQVEVSFGWATRTIGFIALATLLTGSSLMKTRIPPSKSGRALFDVAALRDPSFVVFTFAVFLYLMGIYMPFFYVSAWAQSKIGADEDLAFYLFSILNAGSVFGRFVPGILADRLGSLNVLIVGITISGILMFAWISITRLSETIVFCIFYGFFSGASVSLPGTVIAGITPELNKVGTWMGMCLGIAGLGLLIGNPIAGIILGPSQDGDFVGTQCFAGASVFAGGFFLCVLRYMKYRRGITLRMKA